MPTPLRLDPELETVIDEPGRVVTRTTLGPNHFGFLGHYPGMPILAGSNVLELAHRSALTWSPAARTSLFRVERCRFWSVVAVGDTLTIEVTPLSAPDHLPTPHPVRRCAVQITGPRGRVADIRLCFEKNAS